MNDLQHNASLRWWQSLLKPHRWRWSPFCSRQSDTSLHCKIMDTGTNAWRDMTVYHSLLLPPSMDHSQALGASVAPLPRDWKRRPGRPCHTWLRTVESDLAPLNIGLATAYHRAQNRQAWSKLVGTAASATGQATWWWWLLPRRWSPI